MGSAIAIIFGYLTIFLGVTGFGLMVLGLVTLISWF